MILAQLRTIKVALDLPHAVSPTALFDYEVPEAMQVAVGMRVVVAFGSRAQVGIVVALGAPLEVARERVKPIVAVLSGTAPLSPEWLRLMQFCASYYQHPLGAVMLNALPAQLKNAARDVDARLMQRFGLRAQAKRPPASAAGKRAVFDALQAGEKLGWELAALS